MRSGAIAIVAIIIAVVAIVLNRQKQQQRQQLQHELRYLSKHAFTVFNDNHVFYWADFGTLLGIIRENDIIYGDGDADMCITANLDRRTLRHIDSYLRKHGLYIRKEKDWPAYRIWFLEHKRSPHVDVYINRTSDDGQSYLGAANSCMDIPKRLIGQPRRITWQDVKVFVPERTRETLVWRYGKDYMIPKDNARGRCQGVFNV